MLSTGAIHPMFHVLLLREAIPSAYQVQDVPPIFFANLEWQAEPDTILFIRLTVDDIDKDALVQRKHLPFWGHLRAYANSHEAVFIVLPWGQIDFVTRQY